MDNYFITNYLIFQCRPNPSNRAASRRRRPNPSALPPLLRSEAVAQPSWSPSGGSQGGEEEDRVIYLCPCAPRRRVGLVGAPPPRLSAVCHPAPSSQPLEVTVLLAVRFWMFRCDPRDKWSTPALDVTVSPLVAAASDVAAGRAPPLPRLRRTRAAGSSFDGPDRVNPPVQNFHTGQLRPPRLHLILAVGSRSDGSDPTLQP
jgi:hypothetical protein